MKKILATFCILLFTYPVWATTVIAILGPDFVILGADGKATSISPGNRSFATQNKIFAAGKFRFSMAGSLYLKEAGYNPYGAIDYVLSTTQRFSVNTTQNINVRIKGMVLRYLRYLRSHPAYRKSIAYTDVNIVSYIIVGFLDGLPFAYSVRFHVKDVAKDEVELLNEDFG